jgi:hypothetical protein
MAKANTEPVETECISLEKAVELLLTVVRPVLPGIQTLFGFQLIAVFNAGFRAKLSVHEQYLHLVALGMLAIAIALILTPAAYQRLSGARRITNTFILLCERMLLWSMIPLVFGICIDFYLVSRVVIDSPIVPWPTAALFAVFATMWFVVPRILVARER